MSRPFDIVAYVYRADLYCPECLPDVMQRRADLLDVYPAGFNTEAWLDRCAEVLGIDREDESTFDSDDFPKVVFRDQLEDDERCGRCGRVLEELP